MEQLRFLLALPALPWVLSKALTCRSRCVELTLSTDWCSYVASRPTLILTFFPNHDPGTIVRFACASTWLQCTLPQAPAHLPGCGPAVPELKAARPWPELRFDDPKEAFQVQCPRAGPAAKHVSCQPAAAASAEKVVLPVLSATVCGSPGGALLRALGLLVSALRETTVANGAQGGIITF